MLLYAANTNSTLISELAVMSLSQKEVLKLSFVFVISFSEV